MNRKQRTETRERERETRERETREREKEQWFRASNNGKKHRNKGTREQ